MSNQRADVGFKSFQKVPGSARSCEKISPSFSWFGFIGFNPDRYEGQKRGSQIISVSFISDNII